MSKTAFGSDGLLYAYNKVTQVMEGYTVATGVKDNTFSSNLSDDTNLASNGTLIFGLNRQTKEVEGYAINGTLTENFAVDWSFDTPITVNAAGTVIYGFNALNSEIVSYTIATGAELQRFNTDWNPITNL